MEAKGEKQIIIAEVPMAEIRRYVTELRSLTQGRGMFKNKFSRYEELPEMDVDRVINSINQAKR